MGGQGNVPRQVRRKRPLLPLHHLRFYARDLGFSSNEGDASVPSSLHTTPAPTRGEEEIMAIEGDASVPSIAIISSSPRVGAGVVWREERTLASHLAGDIALTPHQVPRREHAQASPPPSTLFQVAIF